MNARNPIILAISLGFTMACGGGDSLSDLGRDLATDDPADVSADLSTDVAGDVAAETLTDVTEGVTPDVVAEIPVIDATDAGDQAPADAVLDTPPDTLPDAPFNPPACGSNVALFKGLVPGPGQDGYDADLEAKANKFERVWQAFNATAMHLNTDVVVNAANTADRALIENFAADPTAWDFEVFSGKKAQDVITSQNKVAGLYSGDGVAADAYRYAVLRDQGYPCDDVERARAWLLGDLEPLHAVVAITGAPGVIVRGIARRDLPGDGSSAALNLIDLFDGDGNPLPPVKNNGVWRDDFSEGGQFPNLIWEDSVSRDMYIGWAAAYAAVWEVIRQDPAFPQEKKDRLRADALAVAQQLMVVRESGYDLEVPDADGRTTLHGWLNEHNFDGVFYSEEYLNGFHAAMALGVVASWVYVTDDPALKAWLYDQLLGQRRLHEIVRDHLFEMVDMDLMSNYSNYNMAFQGIWLAMRYLPDADARAALQAGLKDGIYDRPGKDRQPADFAYSLYDFVYAEGMADGSAWWPQRSAPDEGAVSRGTQTLKEFATPPYWNVGRNQCPDAVCTEANPQVASPDCTALDGTTHFTVLGCVGRNGDMITAEPIPMRLLGPSNFHWRSNPYQPNRDGEGSALLPGVDFRFAYWMGRFFRRPL
jgi:hypothetical protein